MKNTLQHKKEMSSPVVWLNGTFLSADGAMISAADRGLLIGDGVFDTMLAYEGKPIDGRAHLDRLFDHASQLSIKHPYDGDELLSVISDLLGHNQFSAPHASVRVTITRGVGARGLLVTGDEQPTVMMTAQPYDFMSAQSPASVIIAKTTTRNENSPLSRMKSLNYGDNILARLEAQQAGTDDALMKNNAGHIVCSTIANLFILSNEQLLTPPLCDGVLAGITRQRLCDELSVQEQSITEDLLMSADAVSLTNSLCGVKPVKLINGTSIAHNDEQLQKMQDVVLGFRA